MLWSRKSITNKIYFLGCVLDDQTDYPGHDLSSEHVQDNVTCANLCALTFKCTHWSFDNVQLNCYLKISDGGRSNKKTNATRTSGNRACGCVRNNNVNYVGGEDIDNRKLARIEDCADWSGVLFIRDLLYFPLKTSRSEVILSGVLRCQLAHTGLFINEPNKGTSCVHITSRHLL